MALNDSPSLGDVSENTLLEEQPDSTQNPQRTPPDEHPRWTRAAIIILVVAILATGLVYAVKLSDSPKPRIGSVTVKGQIVGLDGKPMQDAHVFVEGMTFEVITDQTGKFSISGAPDGQFRVVVGVTPEPPQFIVVAAQVNDTKDLGQIVLQALPK